MTKCYLDTCIISGLIKHDLPNADMRALKIILQLYSCSKLSLVTSETAKLELSKVQGLERVRHESLYDMLDKVPVAALAIVQGIIGMGIIPFPRKPKLLEQLENLPFKEMDRIHIFNAAISQCDYFLTTDYASILKHKMLLAKSTNMQLVKPSELIALLKTC